MQNKSPMVSNKELDAVQARWKEEARLPPQKPQATKRFDLKIKNEQVAQEMSSGVFLKTFIGHEKFFSTIPVTQLRIST
jgi:hypothetical protein